LERPRPQESFKRFSDDLTKKPKGSLLGAFQNYLERSYPQIFHSAEIHVVLKISLEILGKEYHTGNQINTDDAKNILIHLLGYRSLVDLQLGGHHIRYLPDGRDEIIFKELRSSYFESFLSNCSAFPRGKWSDLANHLPRFYLNSRKGTDPRENQ
jgi:hypothetical protein